MDTRVTFESPGGCFTGKDEVAFRSLLQLPRVRAEDHGRYQDGRKHEHRGVSDTSKVHDRRASGMSVAVGDSSPPPRA